ncbi:hypothetical protein [Niastella populi]|uniref:Uncharacterized protein n=1 Tax=Niastella populi TaxID=550983 RepID=A0A1V9GB02_9BACT|nr:hypothetical protein [Niastella populi]OQP67851.1 hypothetical protein A4R26_10110 [Niastella populi]
MFITAAIKTLKEVLEFIPTVINVIKNIKKTESSSTLTKVVDTLACDTQDAAVNLQKSIDEIEYILKDSKFDLSKTLYENEDALKFWDLTKNYYLNRATKKIRGIREDLRSSVEDVGRILLCQGKFESMEKFNDFVRIITRDLDTIDDKPIGYILSIYRQKLEESLKMLR